MQSDSLSILILPYAFDLQSELSEIDSFINIGRPAKGNGIIPFSGNEHSDNLLNPIDNEIASKFIAIFLGSDQLIRGKAGKVAIFAFDHYGNFP